MNAKKRWIIIGVLLVILLAVTLTFLLWDKKEQPMQAPSVEELSAPSLSHESSAPIQTEVSSLSSVPEAESTEAASFSFPYSIPGSSLQLISVKSYDGIYLENGADTDIQNVTALILVNQGKKPVEYAEITLHGTAQTLKFRATGLPAGATMVVMEASAQPFMQQTYTAAEANAAEEENFSLCKDQISIRELSTGELEITNISDQTIPSARIFYKFYLRKENVYVGGITYTAKLSDLKPGDVKRVMTSHFAPGKSQIIKVETYDEKEQSK